MRKRSNRIDSVPRRWKDSGTKQNILRLDEPSAGAGLTRKKNRYSDGKLYIYTIGDFVLSSILF